VTENSHAVVVVKHSGCKQTTHYGILLLRICNSAFWRVDFVLLRCRKPGAAIPTAKISTMLCIVWLNWLLAV